MKAKTIVLRGLLALGLLGVCVPMARADISHTFDMVFFENEDQAPTTGLTFTVEVSDRDVGAAQARFTITNTSEYAVFDDPVLTAVYFDDGLLLGISEVSDQTWAPNVWFEEGVVKDGKPKGVSPPDVPGWETIDFETSTAVAEGMFGALLAVDADSPPTDWGLSPGEHVDIVFDLVADSTASDVIARMFSDSDPADGYYDLRVAAHIQRIGVDGDDSGSVVTIPAPAGVVLGAIGLGLVGWVKRRLG